MAVVHQPERTTESADYLSRHPNDYNENEWSKSPKKWERLFGVNSVEKFTKIYYRQLSANQKLNKLFKQPMRAQDVQTEKEIIESAGRLENEGKQIKMGRLQIS